MLDSTLELITQAASNYLFVFCFFNLIIVIILAGSKPGSGIHQQNEILLSIGADVYRNANDQEPDSNKNSVLVDLIEPVEEGKGNSGDRNEDGDVENDKIDEHDNDEGEEDEFRRRIEEFIAKVNKGWRAEMLRT